MYSITFIQRFSVTYLPCLCFFFSFPSLLSPACVWIVVCIQTSKLLHLVGMTTNSLATTCMLVLAYTLPFIRVVSKYTRSESENKAGFGTPRLGTQS